MRLALFNDSDMYGFPIAQILTERDLGNSNIGPEFLVQFPGLGKKTWVPMKNLQVVNSQQDQDIFDQLLSSNDLELSDDGSFIVHMSDEDEEDPEDDELEEDPEIEDDDDFGLDLSEEDDEIDEELYEEDPEQD
jgi:hypothetical protein